MSNIPMDTEGTILCFDREPVAVLSDIFQHQGTWYADYRLVAGLTDRLRDFVEFSRDQLSTDDFDETALRGFTDLYETDLWTVQDGKGEQRVDGAPLFRTTDLSWVV